MLQEYKDLLPNMIYYDVRIYVLCFESEKTIKNFTRMFTAKYILSIDSLPVSDILPLEPGRSIEVYYDRSDYADVLHLFTMRALTKSFGLSSYQNYKYCLEEAVSYSTIDNCRVGHGHFINLVAIRNNPNVSCCVFYNRTWENNTMTLEYICSTKTSLDICVFEARQIQRQISDRCREIQYKEEAKNHTYEQVYEELLGQDRTIQENLDLEPRERGNIKCCACINQQKT